MKQAGNAFSMQIPVISVDETGCVGYSACQNMEFGKWLKAMRDVKGWGQKHLMQASGLSLFTIQKAEASKSPTNLSASTLQKLATAFEQPWEYLRERWEKEDDVYGAPMRTYLFMLRVPEDVAEMVRTEAERRQMSVPDLFESLVNESHLFQQVKKAIITARTMAKGEATQSIKAGEAGPDVLVPFVKQIHASTGRGSTGDTQNSPKQSPPEAEAGAGGKPVGRDPAEQQGHKRRGAKA
jgi:transcriptional regulator with XRE-family HTH domain